jgi:hypothetical protein
MLKWIVMFVGAIAASACDQTSDAAKDGRSVGDPPYIDLAPYAVVAEVDAPTVKDLENTGYSQVDHYPVGCIIPDQPEAACDATGAVFMDNGALDNFDIAIEDDEYDRYEFVCPAIEGKNIADWKCRNQESSKADR